MENVILSLAFKYGIPIQKIISTNELGLDFQTSIGESVDGKKWILRVPRRKNIFSQIQKEQDNLSFLKSKVRFDVPDWKVVNPELIAYLKEHIGPNIEEDIRIAANKMVKQIIKDLSA